MRAYALQNQGFDTVEANHRLGFEDDERNFKIGAEILRLMGFKSVRLMTNNPAKVTSMQAEGIVVDERVPLKVASNPLNEKYLETKAKKSGHLL
jgi:GTP cyclohydrolase II